MRIKTLATGLIIIILYLSSSAQIPEGYYNSAAGLSGSALKTALYYIIDNHTVLTYDNVWTAFQTTDKRTDGKVWDLYSNCNFTFIVNQCGTYSGECDCYNREHSFPRSWYNSEFPMFSDLFQLYPTDGKVNEMRSDSPYGEVGTATYISGNGSMTGNCVYPGFTGTVFEPIDEYKGDFARSYFYMATRYENLIAGWQSNGSADEILNGTTFPCFDTWFINLMGQWHIADPVSQKEINRNNAIYTYFQHNRNPYIDHPEYVYLVWGVGAPPLKPEPTNNPADFSAHNIILQWTDASGSDLPEGYLVRMSSSSFGGIISPADGIPVTDSGTDKNIPFGVQKAWFTNLIPNTTYYFKIFPYTGSGNAINYKTDGIIPQLQQTTGL
jgi:endonuclease I